MPRLRSEDKMRLTDHQQKLVAAMLAGAIDYDTERDKLLGVDAGFFEGEADRNLALMNGEYWPKRYSTREIYSVNHIASVLQVKRVIVTGGKTKFVVTPLEEQFIEVAEAAERTLNYLWQAHGFDRRTDEAYQDTFIHGKGGVVELGWVYEDDGQEMRGDRPGEVIEALAEAALPQDAMPMMAGGEMAAPMPMEGAMSLPPTEFPDEQSAQEFADQPWDADLPRPLRDDPFIERFDPRDLFVDPQCTSFTLEDARYVFRRRYELLSSVKRNKKYRNTSDLKGSSYAYYKGRDSRKEGAPLTDPPDGTKDDFAVVELYDGYIRMDYDNDGFEEMIHVVLAEGKEAELLCEYTPYPFWAKCTSQFPFEICPGFTPDPSTYRSVPDVSMCRDVQIAHDLAFTQVEWAKGHTPNVLLTAEGMFAGPEGDILKRRIELGDENAVLEVNPQFLTSIKWLERPIPRQEDYQTLAEAPQKIRGIIGVSEYQANAMPDKDVKVAEVQYLSGQGGTRQDGEIERYFDFIARIAMKVLILMQQFQERTRPYAYATDDGNQQWGNASSEMLRGIQPGTQTPDNMIGDMFEPGIQFQLEIDPSKKQAKNEITERKQALELLSAMQPFFQMPDPRLPNRPLVNIPPLLRGLLKGYDLPNQSEIISPEPTPEETMQFQAQQKAAQEAEAAQTEQNAMMERGDKEADRDLKREEIAAKAGKGGAP